MDITNEELEQVSKLAERQVEIEQYITKTEENLSKAQAALAQVRDKDLPNALAEVGLSSITLKNGKKITVKTEVYASIPKDNTGPAFNWLRSNGHGALIKNVISAEFGKGEDEKALQAAVLLAEAGYTPNQKESVHAMTLKAFLKEQLNKGVEVPLDAFGAYVVQRSKVEDSN